ncbi:MAG: family 43 glycosylhydrolase [Balneolaceae bacterium]
MFRVHQQAFILGLIAALLAGCGDNSTGTDDENMDEPYTGLFEDFSGPIYSDDYTSIASWADRSSWNLANVHDPTVVKDGDYFYMYQTDASYGNVHEAGGHYPVRRSADLVSWEHMGSVFEEEPAWVKDSLNSLRARMEPPLPPIEDPDYGFWAPHITKVGDRYRLYYSVVVTNPVLGDVTANRWQGLEAPEIIYHEETGYYYLFVAYDELPQAYNTRVARSETITGPYLGIDGGNVTQGAEAYPLITHPYQFNGHFGWVGFAHGSVFQDPDTGSWFYSSQGRLPPGAGGINTRRYSARTQLSCTMIKPSPGR